MTFISDAGHWQCDNDGAVSASVTSPAVVPDGWLTGLHLAAPAATMPDINDLCPVCAALAVSAVAAS